MGDEPHEPHNALQADGYPLSTDSTCIVVYVVFCQSKDIRG